MAKDVTLLIKLQDQASRKLSKINQGAKRLEKAFNKNGKAARDLEAAFQRMGRKGIRSFRDLESNAARLGKRMSGLRGNIAKAGVAFAAFRAVQAGIARAESERRLKLLGQRFGEVGQLQGAASAAARKFNLSQTEANQSLADAFARLRPLGVSLKDITSTFGGFRTAAVLGGATATEASAAFTQLSQALGSGALRGDEFRSIAEQAPLVLQAISDETGVAAGDLKEYAAQGLLTSDIVIKALKRIEAEGADRLAQALGGPAAKIKDFQNKVQDLQVAFTESAIPAITDSIKDLGTVIKQLEPLIRGLGSLLAGVARAVGNVVENVASGGKTVRARQLALQAATLQTNEKFGKPGLFGRSAEASAFFEQTLKREENRRLAIARGAVPGQLPPSAADVAETPKGTSPIKLPPKKKGGGTTADPLASIKSQISALKEGVSLAKTRTVEEKRQQQLLNDIAALSSIRTTENAALVDEAIKLTGELFYQEGLQRKAAEADKQRQEAAKAALQAQQREAERLNSLFGGIGQTISDGIVGALTGAQSAAQALGDTLSNIGKQLLQLGINSLLRAAFPTSSLFSGLTGFANGGRPPVGRPSIVGERGPELFVPSRAGTIVPNHAMGGANVTVNVDASGSSVQGNGPNASQLGKAIGAAVQAELIKQKRPGGLLTR